MIFTKAHDITLEISRAAVEAIFDECDRYNVDGLSSLSAPTRTRVENSVFQ